MGVDVSGVVLGSVGAALAIGSFVLTFVWRRSQQASDRAARLAALNKQYADTVQPALAWLDAFKAQHPGGALWTALQFQRRPPAAAADLPQEQLAAQQLKAALMEEFLAEQRARNQAKWFWEGLLTALDAGDLPAGFGSGGPAAAELCGSAALAALWKQWVRYGSASWLHKRLVTPAQREETRNVSFSEKRWRRRAQNFRELVEPFDLANLHRLRPGSLTDRHWDASEGGRPKIYARLQHMEEEPLREHWHQENIAALQIGRLPPHTPQLKSAMVWADVLCPLPWPPPPMQQPQDVDPLAMVDVVV